MIKPKRLKKGDKIAIVSLSWGGLCKFRPIGVNIPLEPV